MEGAAARKALSRRLSSDGGALGGEPVEGDVAELGKSARKLGVADPAAILSSAS